MNLVEMVKYIRVNLLDDYGGTGVDWESYSETDTESVQLRWTNEEIVRNIQQARYFYYRRTLPVRELDSKFNISLASGKQTYDLNPKIIQIVKARLISSGLELDRVDINDLWDIKDLATYSTTPTKYSPNYESHSILIYPIPDSTDTLQLLVDRFPLRDLTWDNPECGLEVSPEHEITLIWYATHLCYLKDNPNTFDPGRASYFFALFNQECPDTSAYSDNRKRSTSNRPVKYGGI